MKLPDKPEILFIPGVWKNWGLGAGKGPKRPFQPLEPEFRQLFIYKKNNTSPSEIFEKKVIFHQKVDEITSFEGTSRTAQAFGTLIGRRQRNLG